MDVAATLRRTRTELGITQADLARLTGTSQATISAYETGAKEPSLGTFERLLAAMDARLVIEPSGARGTSTPRRPSRAQLLRAGSALVDVLGLAEALPARRPTTLRFPRLAPHRA